MSYDPLECLEKEVLRFKETNTFTPIDVTGFYIQAGCGINELKEARETVTRLQHTIERRNTEIRHKNQITNALEEELIEKGCVGDGRRRNATGITSNTMRPSMAHVKWTGIAYGLV